MADADKKTCTQCHELKPVTDFHRQGKYRKSACAKCYNASRLGSYGKASPETKDKWKRSATAKRYGLSLEQYNELVAGHERCPICLTEDPGGVGWVVDHDHESGEVRGILCSECNLGIGKMRDNIANLTRAQIYLEVNG